MAGGTLSTKSGILPFTDFEYNNYPGACGKYIRNSQFAIALGPPYFSRSQCGKIVEITANGKTARGVVLDSCPSCKGLYLTPAPFKRFAPLSQPNGLVRTTWRFL
ncbi:hypothetical protein FA15DRAFT_660824 [Coprinopsis marcescibilis]|uniref:RlpA-like protein double-psi beta-barrel domain-containing protein n=1 Tax=Coprinopsis marcescibilis TaxID=230819 RepID=A0A5C3KDV2_COPMA|nr:hypothetical protein FA15DRAFT_660824 [Coprinopsis marcescibilis]